MSGFLILAYKNRTRDFDVQIYEPDGSTAVVLQADDVVRVKIGRAGSEPDLDLDSIEATASGSSVTFTTGTNDVTLRLAQADLNGLTPGVYDVEVAVVDNSETAPDDAIKTAEVGSLCVVRTMTGDVTEESSSESSQST